MRLYAAHDLDGDLSVQADSLTDLVAKLADAPAGARLAFRAGAVTVEVELTALREAAGRAVDVSGNIGSVG